MLIFTPTPRYAGSPLQLPSVLDFRLAVPARHKSLVTRHIICLFNSRQFAIRVNLFALSVSFGGHSLLRSLWSMHSPAALAQFIVRHGVTFEHHALMQNPYDQQAVLIVQKENHMGLEIHPPQSGGKVPGASTAVWIFRESAEYLF